MEVHLKVIGFCLILLALMHVTFPRKFDWKNELASLSVMNRQMMYVHTFFIAFIVFLIGILCLTSSSELMTTELGRRISLGLGVFWAVRLYFQFFVYSSETWRGKRLETVVHVMASLFWAYMSVIFILVSFFHSPGD
jgi:hypothetical protein